MFNFARVARLLLNYAKTYITAFICLQRIPENDRFISLHF